MSALGKLEGDFDSDGQVVVQSPQNRVIERSVVVTRTVTQTPVEAPQPVVAPVAQDLFEPASQPPLPYPLAPRPKPADLVLDRSRDDLLTPFGKATLTDRYLMPGESFQDMFARVSCAYADDTQHAQRLYDYMSRLWFMPATPILSNGGTGRGLPISCFLNDVGDSLDSIVGVWNENVWLASNGGLLMGVMLTQRPDLFRAVVVQVPLLDMLRYDKLLAGASWVDEYGSPAVPEERKWLQTMSPYQNLKKRDDFPTPLFVTSTKDDRVHPGHARKYAAKMQSLGMPFLYYENTDGGHAASANLSERAKRQALEFTYLSQRLMD